MNNIFTTLLCLLAATAATSCGPLERKADNLARRMTEETFRSGRKPVVRQREVVGSFQDIAVSTGIRVEIEQSEENSVEVSADKEIVDRVQTEVEGNTLRILYRPGTSLRGTLTRTLVRVRCAELTGVSAASGAAVTFAEGIESDRLELKATSGARIDGEVQTDDLILSPTSGANLTLTGYTLRCKGSAKSGARIDASALVSERASVSATAGAGIRIFAREHLKASATGGATVTYLGEPETSDLSAIGGGMIRRL